MIAKNQLKWVDVPKWPEFKARYIYIFAKNNDRPLCRIPLGQICLFSRLRRYNLNLIFSCVVSVGGILFVRPMYSRNHASNNKRMNLEKNTYMF